jgi:uncharacterized OB-fold protein
MREYVVTNTQVKAVPGDWGIWHRYTFGVAGERFFREMKDHGRLVASVCPRCRRAFVPPSMYCEDCFVEITEYQPVGDTGTLSSFTILYEPLDESRPLSPTVVGLVQFDGTVGGWIAPVHGVAPEKLRIGMKVRAVFKPAGQRQGQVSDLDHFEPAWSAR